MTQTNKLDANECSSEATDHLFEAYEWQVEVNRSPFDAKLFEPTHTKT
ncbi:hypothetical protein FLK61_27910 [Paenalkalicoccus suaedae]|uniref:Uncharacterized protein n=1 Tax=Paenalkalicoccus suaedae TaxID=2592382 RepID=A0A859FBD8_9BACI|nr:hypothetical protein FLK61_27910 [Paenalkalicoccus suaedae]